MQLSTHKARLPSRSHLAPTAPMMHMSKPHKQLDDLRMRVLAQIAQWDQEFSDLRDRVSAIEDAADAHITALLNAAPACGSSELAEAQSAAYRADTLARHLYEHQLATLRGSIATEMQGWVKELRMLHASTDQFWDQVLQGKVKVVWQRLNHLGDDSPDVWHGFAVRVEKTLREVWVT